MTGTTNKSLFLTIAAVILVSLSFGCAPLTQYGKLWVSPWRGSQMTIERLREDWKNFHVYYSGVSISSPGGIMFDPKDDERKLVGHELWTEVKDQEVLSELLLWIRFNPLEIKLWEILGSDNQLFGYMYSIWSHVLIKKIDDKTLWVDELVLPPIVVEREERSML